MAFPKADIARAAGNIPDCMRVDTQDVDPIRWGVTRMRHSQSIAAAFCCLLSLAAPAPRAWAGKQTDRAECWPVVINGYVARSLSEAGQYHGALGYARVGLSGAVRCADTLSIIDSHTAMAWLYAALGQADSSRVHVAAAVDLACLPSFREALPYALLVQSDLFARDGRADSSRSSLKRASHVAEQIGDSLALGVAFLRLGSDAFSRGDAELALSSVDSSLKCLRNSQEAAAQCAAFAARGKCLHRLGRDSLACEAFESAFEFLVNRRKGVISDRGRSFIMDESRDLFSDWEDAWLSQGNDRSKHVEFMALAIAERGRAQALLDLAQPPDTLMQGDSVSFRFVPSRSRRFGPGRNLAEDVAATFVEAVPPDCAVLYYSQLPESLIVWIFKGGALYHLHLLFPARWLETLGPLATAIPDPTMAPPAAAGWWSRLVQSMGADSLYELFSSHCLPDTIVGLLRGSREVISVPDGWLNQIPFAALPIGPHAEPFGIVYPLRFAPSLAFLAQIEQRGRTHSRQVLPSEVMVLGDPASCTPRLPGARAEAESVAARFRTKPILDRAATESLVVANWSRLRVLHLATHGLAFPDPDRALDSYVCLTPTRGADGHLTAAKILRLPESQFELVVLSACETALGSLSQSEGIVGLPRCLLANGAQSVIASMWNLDDRATSWLVQRFYYHLLNDRDEPPKSVALWRAMVETRRRWGDPRYWAAFQLYGAR